MNLSTDPINTIENLVTRNRITGLSIYMIVIVVIVLTLALLPFIYIDISSQSRGVVRSSIENVPLKTAVGGKVTFVDLAKNQTVFKGDTLLKISNAAIRLKLTHNDTLLQNTQELLDDLRHLLNGSYNRLKTSKVIATFNSFHTEKRILERKLERAQLNLERQKLLFTKNVIARSELEEFEFEYKAASQDLNLFIEQRRLSWESQEMELAERLKELENNAISLLASNHDHHLTAPISGTLEQVSGVEEGSVVNASQVVAIISPDTELIVENIVMPEEIGLLREGQPVQFQFDAYRNNQLGMSSGFIKEIDRNITLDENRAHFKVHCAISSKKILLQNGYYGHISKGMTVTTRYILTRRNLFELIFNQMEDWLHPKIIEAATITRYSK